MAPRRRKLDAQPDGAAHESQPDSSSVSTPADGAPMEDVCAEDAPLGGVLLAHAALDQAGAPLAPGASPGGCAGWCARLNLVAVLSADAVRLVRPGVRAGQAAFDHGFVGAAHALGGDAALRQLAWVEHGRTAALAVLSADGRVALLRCVRASLLVQESWAPTVIPLSGPAQSIAAVGDSLAVLLGDTIVLYSAASRKQTGAVRLPAPCSRIAPIGGTALFAFGASVLVVDTENNLCVDTHFGALQIGPVCGRYFAAFNAVHVLRDGAVRPHAVVPADQPIAALVPHGPRLLAVLLDGTAYRVAASSAERLGRLWAPAAEAPADAPDDDDDAAAGDTLALGQAAASRCAIVAGVLPRAHGVHACTRLALLATTIHGTRGAQPSVDGDTSVREVFEGAQINSAGGGYRSAREVFEEALLDDAQMPSNAGGAPDFQAPFGVCRSTGRAVAQLSDLHVCTVCAASYARPLDACALCRSGPVLPFLLPAA